MLYFDGSYLDKGIKSRASYGWIIWGFEHTVAIQGIEGAGLVHGDPNRLNSTRAEHHGALAEATVVSLL